MASAGKATSEAVIIEQITNQIHIHMNVKDLQVETNRKLEVMSSRLDVLAAMTANFFGLTVGFIKKPRCERRESKLRCDLDT